MTITYNDEAHEYRLDGSPVPSVTQITSLLYGNRYADGGAVLAQAQRKGTAVHEYCEILDYGEVPDEIEPQLVGYLIAYKAFLRDYRPTWWMIESKVSHEKLGYAGRVDRVGMVDGKLTVVDIKTTANIDRVAKIAVSCQLAGYAMALESNDFGTVRGGLAVQLKPNGKYTVHNQRGAEAKYKFNSERLFMDLLKIQQLIGGYTWER